MARMVLVAIEGSGLSCRDVGTSTANLRHVYPKPGRERPRVRRRAPDPGGAYGRPLEIRRSWRSSASGRKQTEESRPIPPTTGPLDHQQARLGSYAARRRKPGEAVPGADDAMAGHDQGPRVGAQGGADRPAGAGRLSQDRGKVAVGPRLACRNLPGSRIDPPGKWRHTARNQAARRRSPAVLLPGAAADAPPGRESRVAPFGGGVRRPRPGGRGHPPGR